MLAEPPWKQRTIRWGGLCSSSELTLMLRRLLGGKTSAVHRSGTEAHQWGWFDTQRGSLLLCRSWEQVGGAREGAGVCVLLCYSVTLHAGDAHVIPMVQRDVCERFNARFAVRRWVYCSCPCRTAVLVMNKQQICLFFGERSYP